MSSTRNLSPEEIAGKINQAREAQLQWRRYSLTQRVAALRGFWSALQAERERLAAVIWAETKKPLAEISTMEIDISGLLLKFFTRSAHRMLQDQAVPRPWVLPNKRAYVRHVPAESSASSRPGISLFCCRLRTRCRLCWRETRS